MCLAPHPLIVPPAQRPATAAWRSPSTAGRGDTGCRSISASDVETNLLGVLRPARGVADDELDRRLLAGVFHQFRQGCETFGFQLAFEVFLRLPFLDVADRRFGSDIGAHATAEAPRLGGRRDHEPLEEGCDRPRFCRGDGPLQDHAGWSGIHRCTARSGGYTHSDADRVGTVTGASAVPPRRRSQFAGIRRP